MNFCGLVVRFMEVLPDCVTNALSLRFGLVVFLMWFGGQIAGFISERAC